MKQYGSSKPRHFSTSNSFLPTNQLSFLVCAVCSDFTGSVLRVDVDTDCCTAPYSIPRNNPYFNSTNQPPEIFAHGLHDPGRCAVDRHHTDNNGSLLILCTDASGRNASAGRILAITKGKDYGEFLLLMIFPNNTEDVSQMAPYSLYSALFLNRVHEPCALYSGQAAIWDL
ncbi:unnamed protein product [Oncorhynchus mykiss]|uniref:Uncharacterized protein n=1 Tax=Oncorhynchus mykiss TaxID=8022 RepID=A0A060Z8V6_ONCMY|nr:unnamed protein product [Oncorhynchus mykiss]